MPPSLRILKTRDRRAVRQLWAAIAKAKPAPILAAPAPRVAPIMVKL